MPGSTSAGEACSVRCPVISRCWPSLDEAPGFTIHGVGLADPIVNEASTVALKLKWTVKKTIFRLTRTDTLAVASMWIGWCDSMTIVAPMYAVTSTLAWMIAKSIVA
jgi:hypothetical protein